MRYPKLITILVMAFTLVACAGIQVKLDSQSKEILARSSARIAGALIAKEQPEIIRPGMELCDGIIIAENTTDLSALVREASLYISADPLMSATMSDLASLIEIDLQNPVVTPENEMLIRAAAHGFKEGLLIAQTYH